MTLSSALFEFMGSTELSSSIMEPLFRAALLGFGYVSISFSGVMPVQLATSNQFVSGIESNIIVIIEISKEAYLEPLSMTDAEAIYGLVKAESDMLEKYLYWAASVKDVPSTKKYIEERVASNKFGSAWYKVTLNGYACGVFGVKSVDTEKRGADIGYWLSSNAQGPLCQGCCHP